MPERDYSHRTVVDKLGIKPGQTVAFVAAAGEIGADLERQILERTGRPAASAGEAVDVALLAVDGHTDIASLLRTWRAVLQPAGGIWVFTPKRGRPGYVNQNDLIAVGAQAGLVDNKVCSVSDEMSAMRFVIRRRDRPVP